MPLKLRVGPRLLPSAGMVVYHVEDDFHAGTMVCLDHGFELVDPFAALPGAGVGVVRGEEADSVVSPVVA